MRMGSDRSAAVRAGRAVELSVPAEGAFVAIIRSAVAGVGARLDLTLDDIEDLRMAVGEACALLLDRADTPSTMDCVCIFDAAADGSPGRIEVEVSVASGSADPIDRDEVGWQVLSALTVDHASSVSDGRIAITFGLASTAGGG